MSVMSMSVFPELVPANEPLSAAPQGRAYPIPFTHTATRLRWKNIALVLSAFALGMLFTIVVL